MNTIPDIDEKPTVLIAGCGDIGNRLGTLLVSKGFRVWGLRRNISLLVPGITPIQGDLVASGAMGEWPELSFDYVIYCAAATEHTEENYRSTYVRGMQHILSAIKMRRDAVRRFFFTSSTSVYHQCAGEWVDEASATHPKTMAGTVMLEAERLCQSASSESTVIRLGGIYGHDRQYLLDRVRRGEGYPSSPIVYGNRIHVEDCAGILAFLIQEECKGESLANVYLGVDCQPVALSEVTQWLALQLGVNITRPDLKAARGSKRCSNQRILDQGYHFLYPDYKAGYMPMLKRDS